MWNFSLPWLVNPYPMTQSLLKCFLTMDIIFERISTILSFPLAKAISLATFIHDLVGGGMVLQRGIAKTLREEERIQKE